MLASEHNAWVHVAATLAAFGAALVLGLTRPEWLLLVLAVGLVWIAEAMNTAFERLCDVASPEFHPLVEEAKDIAAGAVLIAALAAAIVGLGLFGPRLAALLLP